MRSKVSSKSQYSRHIILVGKGQQKAAEPLAKKWEVEHPEAPCTIIEYDPNLPPTDPQYEELATLDAHSKLTIIGHGNVGSEFIYGNASPDSKMHYKDLAFILSNHVHPGDIIDGTNKLKISLIVCYGAKSPDNNPKNSLAGNFHRELRLKGFKTDLHGRTAITITQKDGSKSTVIKGKEEEYIEMSEYFEKQTVNTLEAVHSYEAALPSEKPKLKQSLEKDIATMGETVNYIKSLSAHHQRGSKLLFTWDTEGNQKVFEAYIFKRFKHNRFFKEALDPSLKAERETESPSHTGPHTDEYRPH